jgi:hypothetical protein
MPETAEEKKSREAEEWRVHRERRAAGRCTCCNADLATNINRGIIMCAGTHQEQYEKFLSHVET